MEGAGSMDEGFVERARGLPAGLSRRVRGLPMIAAVGVALAVAVGLSTVFMLGLGTFLHYLLSGAAGDTAGEARRTAFLVARLWLVLAAGGAAVLAGLNFPGLPVRAGALLGALSAAAEQGAVLFLSGDVEATEVFLYLGLGLFGGSVGGYVGGAVARDASVRASRVSNATHALAGAVNPDEVARALGQTLFGAGVCGVAVWDERSLRSSGRGPVPAPAGSWASDGGRRWSATELLHAAGRNLGTGSGSPPGWEAIPVGAVPKGLRGGWRSQGVGTLLLGPASGEGGGLGAIAVGVRGSRRLSKGLRGQLAGVSASAWLAMEKIRALEERVRSLGRQHAMERRAALVEDRAGIARRLHDEAVADFSAVVRQLDATLTARLLAPDDAEAQKRGWDHIGFAREAAVRGGTKSRKLLRSLRTADPDGRTADEGVRLDLLEGRTLEEALRGLVSRWSAEEGVAGGLTVSGAPRALGGADTALLRGAQEALSNVAKHARAGRVVLSLCYGAHGVSLAIEDDGVGMGSGGGNAGAWDEGDTEPGYGLRGMQERLEAVGGRVVIGSRPDSGTRVVLEVEGGRPRGEIQGEGMGAWA